MPAPGREPCWSAHKSATDFLACPWTCLVTTDLPDNHWTVSHPGYRHRTRSLTLSGRLTSQLSFEPASSPQTRLEIWTFRWLLLPSPCLPCLPHSGLGRGLTRTLPFQPYYHSWLPAPYSLVASRWENLMGEIRKDCHSPLLLVLGESSVMSHHVLATSFSALCSFFLFAWSKPLPLCTFLLYGRPQSCWTQHPCIIEDSKICGSNRDTARFQAYLKARGRNNRHICKW